MNQEKISQLIKDLRKQKNLTQQEFAHLFGVTYQAVSKWENGKNMPDIEILKQICEEYQLDINDFLKGEKRNKKQKKGLLILTSIVIVIILSLLIWFIFYQETNFEFKTLTTSCPNFNISGSIAYNDKKSAIYISHINYCGGNDTKKYQKIECTLYETHNEMEKKVDRVTKQDTTLEEFLKDLTFYVDNYQCQTITQHTFYLEIDATMEPGNITSYKIPLNVTTCAR